MAEWNIIEGDCIEQMKLLADASVDAVVTDPPYGLEFMGREWDGADGFRRSLNAADAGRDNVFQAFCEAWARECLRVLKPGGHLLAFGGTRTYHRLACAIEDAGFEIRDQIQWLYGSGFPKSLDVSKATDAARQWVGWGTALKPAHEPIVVARKPLIGTVAKNVLAHGTGALNIDACRVPLMEGEQPPSVARRDSAARSGNCPGRPGEYDEGRIVSRITAERYMENRPGETLGRWPANVIHDGSEEVLDAFPQAPGQIADASATAPSDNTSNVYGRMNREGEPSAQSANYGAVGFKMKPGMRRLDSGSAARFFYCAKANRKDRNDGCENRHPTVKPTELMRYLCRLITPAGGVVLDPFAGSGSTGRGAILEGFNFIGIELDAGYAAIARARIRAVTLAELEEAAVA